MIRSTAPAESRVWTRAYNAAIARGLPVHVALAAADDIECGDCRDPSPLDNDGGDDAEYEI